MPSRRLHEASVDPSDGFHDKPGTPSNREGQFALPEAWIVGEPSLQPFFEAFVNPSDEVHSFSGTASNRRFKPSDFFIPNVRISGSVNTESMWSLQTCVMWTSVRFSRVFVFGICSL